MCDPGERSKVILELIDDFDNPVGAEIGVHDGQNAKEIFEGNEEVFLYLIDAWDNDLYEGDDSGDPCGKDAIPLGEGEKKARKVLEPYSDRCEIIKSDHRDVDLDEKLDFVFLDGRHDYKGTAQQIIYWYDVVKKGGLIIGHDYDNGYADFSVKEVVDDMSMLLGHDTELYDDFVWCWEK